MLKKQMYKKYFLNKFIEVRLHGSHFGVQKKMLFQFLQRRLPAGVQYNERIIQE